MTEDRPQYIEDAKEMLGVGYASVVVMPPQRVAERRDGKFIEVETPAWVQFSTAFKAELKTLDEYSLKVFLYIGLSIGFDTGSAYPGVRKIAEETGMNKDTVTKAVENLEKLGFMTILRRTGASNTYTPAKFFSIGTVRRDGTPPELSDENDKLSDAEPKLSDGGRVDLHNYINNTNNTSEVPKSGKPDLLDGVLEFELKPQSIRSAVSQYFPFNVNWQTKTNRQWMEWAIEAKITPEQLKKAAEVWRSDRKFNWRQPTLMLIYENWPALCPKDVHFEVVHKPTELEKFIKQESEK